MANNQKKGSTLINIPELSAVSDTFVDLDRYRDYEWVRLSGMPRNALERAVRRPKLSRYRGAIEAALAARRVENPIIVSHMPRMSAAVNRIARILSPSARHIAFSFNFTDLPTGKDRDYLARSFDGIDRFIVYSEYERGLYAEHFGIPLERMRRVLWTQDVPPVDSGRLRVFEQPYLCAIGGEGRDFHCLVEAARQSQLPLAIVARPNSLAGLTLPDNVRVFSNLPLAETWGIAANSQGVVVPLLRPTTCCGQITVVSAMMLGLPLITTACYALEEYIAGESVVVKYRFGDSQDLADAMSGLLKDSELYALDAAALSKVNRQRFARKAWADCIESCIDDFENLVAESYD